jgi:hypothetical protein
MSVKIDNMGATTFTGPVSGVLRSNPDTSSFAVSCSQVVSISTFLIPLIFNGLISFTGIWSNVLTNLVKTQNPSSTNIRGSVINIGGASTTVSVLGNTLNTSATYPTILSGISNMGRFQAGYVTLPIGTTLITPPNLITGGSTSVHTTGTINGVCGYGGVNASGFNLITTVAQPVNWIYFL